MNYKHLHYFWIVAKAGGIQRAAEQLHTTPQTLSGQIKLLESRLGKPLFTKRGRNLELTELGNMAMAYADEIFSLGAELEQAIRNDNPAGRGIEFRIGVSDALPKSIAYKLVEPALRLDEPVRLVCREGKLEPLLAELAAHRLDLVLADSTVPPKLSIKAFSHKLGRSGQSFFASRALARQYLKRGQPFPACLEGAPLLLQGEDSGVKLRLENWLASEGVAPRVVGVFDDSALMKAFGREGLGIFSTPTVIEAEVEAQFGVQAIGRTEAVWQDFYAISVERRITHPCVRAISDSARGELFITSPTAYTGRSHRQAPSG